MSQGRLMISAAGSGHGKSIITMGLLEAMKERGISLQSFKCGPDYIDPGFHERVLGIPCRNLDTYLMGETEVLEEVALAQEAGRLCVAEGAMGLMDGLGGTARHSAYHIAMLCRMKVLAVLDAGQADSDCEQQLGSLLAHDKANLIRGVLVNRCDIGEFACIKQKIQDNYPVQVCGFLPPMAEAVFASRHLGLVGADEAEDFADRVHQIARFLEENGCVDQVLQLVQSEETEHTSSMEYREETDHTSSMEQKGKPDSVLFMPRNESTQCVLPRTRRANEDQALMLVTRSDKVGRVRVAVARDEAFSFLYQRSLENLERAGADLCFFSPLQDAFLPDHVHGLYLPGGYPELYASKLEENRSMRQSVRLAVLGGLPTIAECGGFLYLGRKLCAQDKTAYEMAGVLEGTASRQEKLVRFGYLEIVQDKGSSLLFREGERITAHEFHYWDSTANGEDLLAEKRSRSKTWRFGFASPTLYAGFPHIYLNRLRAERFMDACRKHFCKKE